MEAHFQSLNVFRQSSRRRLRVGVKSILRSKKFVWTVKQCKQTIYRVKRCRGGLVKLSL